MWRAGEMLFVLVGQTEGNRGKEPRDGRCVVQGAARRSSDASPPLLASVCSLAVPTPRSSLALQMNLDSRIVTEKCIILFINRVKTNICKLEH